MNVNELRIGNIFIEKYSKEIISVIGLEENVITFSGAFLGKWQTEPIPLTEKLLVDLGFEPSAFTGLYYDKEGIIDIKVSWDNKFTVYYKNFEIREVEFLHDLQNLVFTLTK